MAWVCAPAWRLAKTSHTATIGLNLSRCLSSKSNLNVDSGKPSAARHNAKKAALKQIRRENFERHAERLERLKTRRANRPDRGKMGQRFREWHKRYEHYIQQQQKLARKSGQPWRIHVQCVVERSPRVMPELPLWEREFLDLKHYLNSYGKVYPVSSGLPSPGANPQEGIHPMQVEPEKVPLTEADRSGNLRTADRCLSDKLFLAVQLQNEGNDDDVGAEWTFPTATLTDPEETMLDAAKRAVRQTVGEDLELYCPSRAPMGVRLDNAGDLPDEPFYGDMTFLYKVHRFDGIAALPEDDDEDAADLVTPVKDFAWLTKEEMLARYEEGGSAFDVNFHRFFL